MGQSVCITRLDFDRLTSMIELESARFDTASLEQLDRKLSSARIVDPREIPADLVTMNSRVRYQRAGGASSREVALVYPSDAAPDRGRVSVLSPIGVSLIGRRAGEVTGDVERLPSMRVRIAEVSYQPEANGHFDL
jgi:regulator of nucleoside diphosphate kinase